MRPAAAFASTCSAATAPAAELLHSLLLHTRGGQTCCCHLLLPGWPAAAVVVDRSLAAAAAAAAELLHGLLLRTRGGCQVVQVLLLLRLLHRLAHRLGHCLIHWPRSKSLTIDHRRSSAQPWTSMSDSQLAEDFVR